MMMPSAPSFSSSSSSSSFVLRRSTSNSLQAFLLKLTNKQKPTKVLYFLTVSFLVAGLLYFLLNALGAKVPTPQHDHHLGADGVVHAVLSEAKYNPYARSKKRNRLAIVIPYLPPSDGAPTFPPYFDLFAMSAAGSAADIDYLIFHCFIPPSFLPNKNTLPTNVKLIDLNVRTSGIDECGMATLFTRVTDQRQKDNSMETSLSKLIHMLSTQIINLPYILVEYKPAFGHIFAEYLRDYTHWGYSDLDVVFGDMTRWIDEDEWNEYDIVTYGFGDQDKLYLRGQFTFHRNDPHYINQLWRHCKYLSEMDVRYAHTQSLKFESAEGCYSQAVITRKDIKVKWAVKAFTDVGENSPIYTQGVYLSLGTSPSLTSSISYNPKSVLYTAATIESGKQLLTLPHDWFKDKSKYPNYSKDIPIQRYVGEKTKVTTYRTLYESGNASAAEVKCMYWAPKTYQMDICVVNGNVENDDVVILEKGTLYKQKFVQRENMFPDGIKSFPFFHFQEWKRIYRTTQLLPSQNARQTSTISGLIITKEGSIPMFSSTSSSWNIRHKFDTSLWMSTDTGSTAAHPSCNTFCLSSSPKGHPVGATSCKEAASWPQPDVDHTTTLMKNTATVTIVRSPAQLSTTKIKVRGRISDLKPAMWWDEKRIDPNNDVTLALTLQISALHMTEKTLLRNLLALAESNIYAWGARQPSILLIHVESSSVHESDQFAHAIQLIKDTFAPEDASSRTSHLNNSLVAIINTVKPTVSRKGLLNMATFAAPTRWVISGVELERGLLLSREASVYAMRAAKVHSNMPGHIWVIPQFASLRDDTREEEDRSSVDRQIYSGVGIDLLPSIRGKRTMVSNLLDYDCVKCGGVDDTDDGADEEDSTDGVDDAARQKGRRLADVYSSSNEHNVEKLLEDLWWDLSIADVYGTPGGFNSDTKTSLEAMAKIHDRIEVALISLLDLKGDHLDYLRNFDKSVILMIDRLGPKKEMMTLDLAPEVEDFRGRKCFNLLRLAQLAGLGYKVSVLPGTFAASYPNTRDAICTESIKHGSSLQCDCELESDAAIKEILIDEVKRPAKVAVLLQEQEHQLTFQ